MLERLNLLPLSSHHLLQLPDRDVSLAGCLLLPDCETMLFGLGLVRQFCQATCRLCQEGPPTCAGVRLSGVMWGWHTAFYESVDVCTCMLHKMLLCYCDSLTAWTRVILHACCKCCKSINWTIENQCKFFCSSGPILLCRGRLWPLTHSTTGIIRPHLDRAKPAKSKLYQHKWSYMSFPLTRNMKVFPYFLIDNCISRNR